MCASGDYHDCGGDPGAAIEALEAVDATTTVNVVGFALEERAMKDEMTAWALLGGGDYFDAVDQAGLDAAVAAALLPPFLVFDETGVVVARGALGGAAVEVSEGVYRVEVLSDPPETFEVVEVEAGADVGLTAGSES